MRVLGLETATPFLVVGLIDFLTMKTDLITHQSGTRKPSQLERITRVERSHAEQVIEHVNSLLLETESQVLLPDLIAVGTGPGSYTGVRVGASCALGLARAWNCAVVGIPTLEIIAASTEGIVAVSCDARKGQVYGAVYCTINGLIAQTIQPISKYSFEDFDCFIPKNAFHLHNQAPSGIALARLGFDRLQKKQIKTLELSYL